MPTIKKVVVLDEPDALRFAMLSERLQRIGAETRLRQLELEALQRQAGDALAQGKALLERYHVDPDGDYGVQLETGRGAPLGTLVHSRDNSPVVVDVEAPATAETAASATPTAAIVTTAPAP